MNCDVEVSQCRVLEQSTGDSIETHLRARLTAADWRHCFSGRVLWDNALARQFDVGSPSQFVVIAPSGEIVVKSTDLSLIEEVVSAAGASVSERPPNGP